MKIEIFRGFMVRKPQSSGASTLPQLGLIDLKVTFRSHWSG